MSTRLWTLISLSALISMGCPPPDDTIKDDTGVEYVDSDGDGYNSDEDCDDGDPTVHPGAEEACDEVDNDCDGEVDEGAGNTYYADSDYDGYGNPDRTIEACEAPDGYVNNTEDCDDEDAEINPDALEICNGVDDDCDELIDDDDDSVDITTGTTWYADTDGDGYGDEAVSTQSCDMPSGYVENPDDCDDMSATQYPGADEYCNGEDDDCDGEIDENTVDAETYWYADNDGDGFGDVDVSIVQCTQPEGYVLDYTDCDDAEPTTYPGATEYCDGADNDCDGATDEDTAVDGFDWYADTDIDGFGDPLVTSYACYQPRGYVLDNTDCDDTDAMQFPGADEYCNGEDDDCDGTIDEDAAIDVVTWYADMDMDGYGDAAVADIDCNQPLGYVLDDTDCDDSDASQYPGADEVCNGEDDDCDGDIDEDESIDVLTWYADADADSYGDPAVSDIDCYQPTDYVADNTDCDDDDPAQYPGADEYCNGEDDDCDGLVDEDAAVDVATWYADTDIDTYGDPLNTDIDCDQPRGYVADNTDCDDTDPAQYPGADEYCNGEDDDCDGTVDEDTAMDVTTWYADTDSDTYGDPAVSDIDCNQPFGYVADNTDCDDADPAQYPGADEYCNGEDDDCDGDIDEDTAVDVSTWYADVDSDTYGDPAVSDIDCNQPTGYVTDNTDCDDTDAAQYPGADEYCNGEDDDCDGAIDEDGATDVLTWYADVDADGYGNPTASDIDCYQPTGFVADNTDCDDSDPAQYPGADEYCNGEDDDCDGTIDEDDALDVLTWYADADADTYGNDFAADIDCYQPSGFVADNTDCDDSDPAQYPGATEYCNGEDDDCDGAIDEDGAADVLTWYADVDSDGFGDPAASDIDCYQPTDYVADGTDCDDSDPAQYPGADEYCNGEDDDCDGSIDEDDAMDVLTWYADADMDNYGNPSVTDIDCYQPSGYLADNTDCDDSDPAQYPGADEYCNGEDDDCDGSIDEDGEVLDGDTFYADTDTDGTGDPDNTILACTMPSGYVDNTWDCDDTDGTEPVVTDAASGSSSGAGTMSSPLDTLQAAVDNSTQCVIAYPGTYYEAVHLNGINLVVTGIEGADTTIIDAMGMNEPALTIDSSESMATVIDGFTLTGDGHLEEDVSSYGCTSIVTCYDYYYTWCGGGLYVDSADPTIRNVVAYGSALPVAATVVSYPNTYYTYSYGGGMCFLDSSSEVNGSTVQENFADQGGGVYADETSAVIFDSSYVVGNEATDGAGMEIEGGIDLSNVASMFNDATSEGGGMFLVAAYATVINTTYAGDDAPSGGAINASSTTSLNLINSIIYGASSGAGVLGGSSAFFSGTYNNVYGNLGGNYSGLTDPTGSNGNISDPPMFTAYSDDGVFSNDDLHLMSVSPSIDAGDPSISYDDADGTTNDQGAYGGPASDWD